MRVHSSTHIGSQLKLKSFFVSIITFYLFSFSLSFAGSVPHLINYQGMLTDAQGEPLETKEYILSFSIFSEPTDGTAVWGPQVFDGIPGTGHGAKVPVVRGHFNVILGPKDTSISNRDIASAFVTKSAYLEIIVGDGAPISPRQQILSTPYAVRALHGVPTGTIVAFWEHTAPPGWLLCDGALVPSGPEYATLRSIVGASVPDLRGLFLRGRNSGRTDGWGDYERGMGNLQIDATRRPNTAFTTDLQGKHHHHLHDWKYVTRKEIDGNYGFLQNCYNDNTVTSDAGAHTHTITGGGDSETRPKNISVNWIIKY